MRLNSSLSLGEFLIPSAKEIIGMRKGCKGIGLTYLSDLSRRSQSSHLGSTQLESHFHPVGTGKGHGQSEP